MCNGWGCSTNWNSFCIGVNWFGEEWTHSACEELNPFICKFNPIFMERQSSLFLEFVERQLSFPHFQARYTHMAGKKEIGRAPGFRLSWGIRPITDKINYSEAQW